MNLTSRMPGISPHRPSLIMLDLQRFSFHHHKMQIVVRRACLISPFTPRSLELDPLELMELFPSLPGASLTQIRKPLTEMMMISSFIDLITPQIFGCIRPMRIVSYLDQVHGILILHQEQHFLLHQFLLSVLPYVQSNEFKAIPCDFLLHLWRVGVWII